jgi:hypothetical protein
VTFHTFSWALTCCEERLARGDYDQLHHFIAAGVWDAAPVDTELLVQADKLVGSSDAVLVIDDTAIPKKGTFSVGVAPQYASALGEGELFYFFLGAGPVFGGLLAPSVGDLQAAETRFFTTVTAPS